MKKNQKPPRIRRLVIGGLFLIIALAIAGVSIFSFCVSRVVNLERVTLYLDDLPAAFEGKTVLFLSDIDMVGLSTASGAARLLDKLALLKPDMLILGGDYASHSLFDVINSADDALKLESKRREFFSSLADFDAPLGKFAVAGENEADAADLRSEMALGGVALMSDEAVRIDLGGDTITLVGLSDYSKGLSNCAEISGKFSRSDCVIVISHNPSAISGVITTEAGDTGPWCDVMLTGHTHGGQMVLGGRSVLKLTDQEKRFPAGWTKESGTQILVSTGVGCETVNLRLGTSAKAHLITLKRAAF